MNWAPFLVCDHDRFPPAPRGINTPEGLGDRLRVAAFAELQAREAFRWAADTLLDATPGQRAAWRRIADDEHRHLELLLGRMRELGVDPAVRPVSDRLWRSLRACKTAREFVPYMRTAEERGRAAEESFRRSLAQRDPVTSALFGAIADDEAEHIALSRTEL
ncbi:MAG TPA: ferritin-like domain-containing protein [Elusimicrobiota bacterium]|nr:ferritin-like domain-containing protein [Elusimicrobiota bacterium]